jgi:transcriptional regulator with XRE-family HTH domain
MEVGSAVTFGQKLRELMTAREHSRASLAAASGVPVSTITGYISDIGTPSLPTAIALANALGVSVVEFAGCEFKSKRRENVRP